MIKIRSALRLFLLLSAVATVSGCSVVSGVFYAGVWVGALVTVVVFAVIFALVLRGGGK